jgi:hypothetical protein
MVTVTPWLRSQAQCCQLEQVHTPELGWAVFHQDIDISQQPVKAENPLGHLLSGLDTKKQPG